MLSQTKRAFKTNVENILNDALYNSLTKFYRKGEDDDMNSLAENTISAAAKVVSETFSSEVAGQLVEEIDKYIKSIGISITTSPADIQLFNAMGPVTGSINITPQTSKITIT